MCQSAAQDGEGDKQRHILLEAFGIKVDNSQFKQTSGRDAIELALHEDDAAAIEEFMTEDEACRAEDAAENARSEAFLYEQLMQAALRNRPIMDFIFAKVQDSILQGTHLSFLCTG